MLKNGHLNWAQSNILPAGKEVCALQTKIIKYICYYFFHWYYYYKASIYPARTKECVLCLFLTNHRGRTSFLWCLTNILWLVLVRTNLGLVLATSTNKQMSLYLQSMRWPLMSSSCVEPLITFAMVMAAERQRSWTVITVIDQRFIKRLNMSTEHSIIFYLKLQSHYEAEVCRPIEVLDAQKF